MQDISISLFVSFDCRCLLISGLVVEAGVLFFLLFKRTLLVLHLLLFPIVIVIVVKTNTETKMSKIVRMSECYLF